MLPFLFTTLKRRLGTEDTKWWSVSGVILSHSSCKQVLRWATVRGLRCCILRFKMRHTFSIGDRSGLQAGQSSTRTLFLRSQDFVMCAECGFALSCWNMHGRPWKRCLLEGSILCSNDRKGCIFTNDMKLTRQNMKYFVFILSAMKYKSK